MDNPGVVADDNTIDVEQYTIHSMPASFMRRATGIFSVMKGEKARMLRGIGFSCLRRIGVWGRLDDSFTVWLLRHLDTETMTITTNRATVIPVTDVDVSLVLGTPKDGPYIDDAGALSPENLEIMLRRLFVNDGQGSITLEHLESLLSRDYNAFTPEPEKDAFRIAAVLYSWATIFSVDATHPLIPYGLLRYLRDTSMIKNLNWSALILESVTKTALKLQGSIASGSRELYITGCPLFLQVFYVDNLDFGDCPFEDIYLPRISQYSEENTLDFANNDRDHQYTGFFKEFGVTKALPNHRVVYCRNVVYSRNIARHPVSAVSEGRGKKIAGHEQCSSLMEQLKEALKANTEDLMKKGLLKTYYHGSSSKNSSINSTVSGMDVTDSNGGSSSNAFPNGENNNDGIISTSERAISINSTVSGMDVTHSNGGSSSNAIPNGENNNAGIISTRERAIQTAFKRGSVYNVFKRFKTFSAPKNSGPIRKKCVTKTRFRQAAVLPSDAMVLSVLHGEVNHGAAIAIAEAPLDTQLIHGLGHVGTHEVNHEEAPENSQTQLGNHLVHGASPGQTNAAGTTVSMDVECMAMVLFNPELWDMEHGEEGDITEPTLDELNHGDEPEIADPPIDIHLLNGSGQYETEAEQEAETVVSMDVDIMAMVVYRAAPGELSHGGELEIVEPPVDTHELHHVEDREVAEPPSDTQIFLGSGQVETHAGQEAETGAYMDIDNVTMVVYTDIEPLDMVPPGMKVKIASYNSDYPDSPFSMSMAHPEVDRKKSRALQRVLESRMYDSSVWFESSLIWGGSLTGSALADQMKRGGTLGAGACDAVILSHAELDSQMYGADRKHWKGYLPASFSKIIFQASGDEYLYDDRVRDMFIGEHLQYDFEHCRKIVAPVEFDQSYSCYIWDTSAMDCHVLDPVLMNKSEKKAEEHHAWPMKFLTAALVKCVKAFFRGWRLPEGDWFMSVSTDIGQRCRPANSAVYSLHYARWYNVLEIMKNITDAELGDIRAGMLLQIISLERNEACFRSSLLRPGRIGRGL